MLPILLTTIVVLAVIYVINSVIKPAKFPPGPKWYPFIGCSNKVELMTRKYGCQWKAISAIANEYGTQVLGLKLGGENVVVVLGEKYLRQVFTEKEFEGRPDGFFFRLRCLGKKIGITFADGPLWREHRHFTVKQLRNVGFGKTTMEREIQNEIYNLVDYIKNNNGKSINLKRILAVCVMNVLWRFVAGERIKEERLNHLLELLNARSKAFSIAGGWLNQMPWCRYIFPELSGYSLIVKMNKQISDIIEETIQKHVNKKVEGNDFIYSFLEEMKENKDTFTEEQLTTICLDLLIAGSQTTSNVLEFAILSALRNSDIQEKIYNEIISVVGDNEPSWSDSHKLIYTSAFLLEVQRYYTIVPLAGPRRVLNDTYLGEYLIPKDTTILLGVGDVHFDPELWENPNEFNPERFIDKDGTLKSTEHMYHFGLGRRRCPGDSLAKSFIFIVFVGLMQKYRVNCSNGTLPSGDSLIGIISAPKPFTADFVPRKQIVV